jgi:hypothetical protein
MEYSDIDLVNNWNQLQERNDNSSYLERLNNAGYILFWASFLGGWINTRKHENAKHLLQVGINIQSTY